MSQHRDDWLSEDLVQDEKQRRKVIYRQTLLVQKYLQNPFSVAWAKMDALLQAMQTPKQLQESEEAFTENEDLYPNFLERVDPSLYYSIFFPFNRF